MRHSLLPRSRRLRGLSMISDSTTLPPEKILDLIQHHRFPAKRDRSGYWTTSTAAMDRWLMERRRAQIRSGVLPVAPKTRDTLRKGHTRHTAGRAR